MNLTRTVPPVDLPLTVDEVKLYSKIDHEVEDSFLETLISSACDYAETFQHRQLMPATWRMKLHCWHDETVLPVQPVQSITSVTYVDPDGTTQTLSSSVYSLDTDEPATLRLAYGQNWPDVRSQTSPPITITFVAGYANQAAIPSATLDALYVRCDHRYRDRDGSKPMPAACDDLLRQNCWGDI